MKVKTDVKTVTVDKLPLGKYAELLRAVKELPKHVQGLDKLENQVIISKLPDIIAGALPDFINIITLATDLTKEEAEQLGLDEATDVVLAIIEVNNYKNIYDKIKKALARPEQTPEAET